MPIFQITESRRGVIMAIKTRMIIILALLTFIVPIGNAMAADFHFINFFADNRSYEDSGVRVYEYLVFPNISTTDPNFNVYVQGVPGANGDEMLIPTPDWKYVFPQFNMFYKYFDQSGGYPPPGSQWEDKDYLFYIDENNSGYLDDGDTKRLFSIPLGSIKEEPMDFVQNVTITGTHNPVITWDGVEGSDRVNFYRIRLFAVVDDKPSFKTLYLNETIQKNGSGSYSYTYNGSLFYQYETLAIAIEAWEIIGELINRSRYVVIHNAGPLYTQEEVDQIVEESCPGNSEYHGR